MGKAEGIDGVLSDMVKNGGRTGQLLNGFGESVLKHGKVVMCLTTGRRQ